jgi:hypothetical protein
MRSLSELKQELYSRTGTNWTNWNHACWAMLIQAIVAALFSLFLGPIAALWVGAAAGVGFFVGREHDQRQREIEVATGMPIIDQNPLHAFLGWSPDAKMDLLLPWLFCATIAGVGSAITILVR